MGDGTKKGANTVLQQADDAVRSFSNTATLRGTDRSEAAAKTVGETVAGLIKGEKLKSPQELNTAYQENLAEETKLTAEAKKRSPIISDVGSLAGAMSAGILGIRGLTAGVQVATGVRLNSIAPTAANLSKGMLAVSATSLAFLGYVNNMPKRADNHDDTHHNKEHVVPDGDPLPSNPTNSKPLRGSIKTGQSPH